MSNEYGKPGDTILIDDRPGIISKYRGEQFTAIECPKKYKGGDFDIEGMVWFNDNGFDACVKIGSYTVVKPYASCEPADVDKSLDKQRDDNLWSVFG